MNKNEIYQFLDNQNIKYEVTNHQAVFNVEEVSQIKTLFPYQERGAKNLFICDDKKNNYYLITIKEDKKLDLKEFQNQNKTRRLSFANEKDLLAKLKLTPGSVTPLGLLNDKNKEVIFYIDDYFLSDNQIIGIHPNDNTATIWLKTNDLINIIKNHGNQVNLFSSNKHLNRCKWCNLKNPLYIKYHDEEWGRLNYNEHYLFEMLILESFQAGLSWECVLNKRASFKKAYDNFNLEKICEYDDKKISELLNNQNIIRNQLKIKASINNAKIFKEIVKEYNSFSNYLKQFTKGKVIYEINKTTSPLSDAIAKDLQNRGMKFVGSTIIYSYLQAIGLINSHEPNCFLSKKTN